MSLTVEEIQKTLADSMMSMQQQMESEQKKKKKEKGKDNYIMIKWMI